MADNCEALLVSTESDEKLVFGSGSADVSASCRPETHRKRLTYPRELLSLGFIVSDSLDYSAREVRAAVQKLGGDAFASVLVLQRDYGYSQVCRASHRTAKPHQICIRKLPEPSTRRGESVAASSKSS